MSNPCSRPYTFLGLFFARKPHVHPQDLTPRHLTFLSSLLSEAYRYLKELQEPTEIHRIPDEISGALPLATKYEIDSLQRILKNALMKVWPRTLQDWDQRVTMINERGFVRPDPGMFTHLVL